MTEPTNAERAARVVVAMAAYKQALNESGPCDTEEDIVDLLTDMHHHLRSHGEEDPASRLDRLLVSAHNHFEAEAPR